MRNDGGSLSFDAYISNTQFRKDIAQMQSDIRGLTLTVERETRTIDESFRKLGRLAAGVFTFNEARDFVQRLIEVRGEFQNIQISLETMLGSKAKADRLFAEVVQLAATTPFGLKDAAAATKQLLAYGSASETVVNELRMLGDISAGVGSQIGDITYLYGTLRSQGRAYAVDIRQFASRGIPIYAELAKVLGINVDQVNAFVEQGKVGFKEVEQAFRNMTGEGGLFFNLMEKQSKSLTGLTSQLKDAIQIMFNQIGESQEGTLAGSIKFATLVVKNYEPIVDVLTVLISTYGAYRAAIVATAAVQSLQASMPAIQAFISLASSIRSAADAQALFNLVTKANPYVIAGTALVSLITAVALFRDTATEAELSQRRLNTAIEEADRVDIQRKIRIDELKKSIQDENKSQEERRRKLQELIALSPKYLDSLTLENIATRDGARAIDEYVAAMKERERQQAIYDERQKLRQARDDIKSGRRDADFRPGFVEGTAAALASVYGDSKLQEEGLIIIERNKEQALKEIDEKDKQLFEQSQKWIEARRDQRRKASKDEVDDSTLSLQQITDKIDQLRQSQMTATSSTAFKELDKQIDRLDAKRRAITGELTSDQKKLQKDADKIGPFGSISYWEEISRRAQEVIDKTPSSNVAMLSAQSRIKADADKKAEDLRKKYAVKSFEDELNEKRNQYALYQRWVEAYGQKAADQQFSGLVSQSQTYMDYIQAEIKKLESIRLYTPLNQTDTKKLDALNQELNAILGADTAMERFATQIENAEANAESLTDAIQNLVNIQSGLSAPINNEDFKKREIVAKKILELEKRRKQQLKEFLAEVSDSNQKRLQIEKYYNDLLLALDEQYHDKNSAEYTKARGEIEKKRKSELDEEKRKLLEESKAYKDLEKVIMATGVKAIEEKIKRTRAAMEVAKSSLGVESEEYKRLAKELQGLEISLDSEKAQNFNKLASVAGQLGDALAESNGSLGEMGKLISGVAANAGNLSTAFSDTATNVDKMAAAAQSVVNLIGLVIQASNQRKLAEQEYFRSVIGQQAEYNLLLNEQIGLQSQIASNVFTDDFEGRLTDGLAQLKDAQEQYQAALDALNEGMVKDGQRNKVDWNAVGKGAVSGVTLGASIGSVIPVIGTAVGAAVGGIVGGVIGLFGGKKKKDEFVGLLAEYPELIQKGADGQEKLNKELAQSLINNNLLDDKTKQLVENAIEWTDAIEAARQQIKGVVSELAGSLGDNLRDALVGAFEDGSDAALAFGDSVENVLEDVLSKIIFNAVFKEAFDMLEKDLIASSDIGGDGSWIDDFGKFYAQQGELINQFNSGLAAAQKEAKKFGLDIFTPDKAKDTISQTAQQGTISGASQEAIDILTGQINAGRVVQSQQLDVARSQLFVLTAIQTNTGSTATNTESIRRDIAALLAAVKSDPMRALGGA